MTGGAWAALTLGLRSPAGSEDPAGQRLQRRWLSGAPLLPLSVVFRLVRHSANHRTGGGADRAEHPGVGTGHPAEGGTGTSADGTTAERSLLLVVHVRAAGSEQGKHSNKRDKLSSNSHWSSPS